MSPLFRRGELKAALIDVLGVVGPANGYVIMQTIADQLGDAWQPSPGAVYPALLGLEDAGLIVAQDQQGSRFYALSASGRRALTEISGTLDDVAARARSAPPRGKPFGRIIDEWAGSLPGRERRMNAHEEDEVRRVLDDVRGLIQELIQHTKTKGNGHG